MKKVHEQTQLPLESGTKTRASLDEVVAFCLSVDLPKEDGEYFFWTWDANGWKNNRQPIKNWQSVIRAWKAAGYCPSQKNQHRQVQQSKPNETALLIMHQKEYERVCERMVKIKSGYDHHQTWSAKDVTEFNTLKKRKGELKGLLGITI